MTDVELDERVTALEENGGDGNEFNGQTIVLFKKCLPEPKDITFISSILEHCKNLSAISNQRFTIFFSDTIAFHTVLTNYDTISVESAVLFSLC